MSNIGERLKHSRTVRGISQTALADAIGASRGVITNIERNIVTDPQPIVINAICNVLYINEDWLLSGKGAMDSRGSDRDSSMVLDEIYRHVVQMSEQEQLFILDVINSYNNRFNKEK